MGPAASPRWRRRKDARPGEIVAAAFAVFAEKGFAAARLDDIAARAGVSKGALYLYFATKEDLFHAVVADAVAPNLAAVRQAADSFEGGFAELVRFVVPTLAKVAAETPLGGVIKMVIGESRNFPTLAKVWHDDLVAQALAALAGVIKKAQALGEVKAGDPRAYAIGLIGPMLLGVIWRETFEPIGAPGFDLPALARQHVETVLSGMLCNAPADMNPQRLLIVVLALAALAVGGYLWLTSRAATPRALSGYIEGEPLYLAAPISGQLTNVAVRRGQRVAAGDILFTVDARQLAAQRDEASGQIAQATSAVAAAKATAAQLAAQTVAAKANLDEAEREAARLETLLRVGHGAVAVQDAQKAAAAAEAAKAQLEAAERQAEAAGAQVGQAGGQLGQAQGARADAEAKLDQAAPRAPAAARVEDTFFQTGEWANANQPVVSLLPDDRVRLRFFAPERDVARYHVGAKVRFSCDGCAAGLTAVIDYVSPQPEFTPPVIYSLQSRDRLVFLIEARPVHPEGLTPGLPIDVAPQGPGS